MNNEQWQISGIFPTKVSKLLHSVLDWELCFHCRQVQPRHLPAKTGLPGKLNILLTKKMGWFSDLNQTMTGLATTTPIGACSDYLTVAGPFGGFSVSFSTCCQLFHTLVDFLSAFPHVARSDWHRPASYLWHQQRLSQWVKIYFSTFSILCSVRRVWWELNGHDQSDFHFHFLIFHFSLSLSQLFLFSAVYAEFGASATDTISLTFTYGSTTSAKTWNVLLRQIACTASYKWVECSCHKLHEWQTMLNWQELPAQGSHWLCPILHGHHWRDLLLQLWPDAGRDVLHQLHPHWGARDLIIPPMHQLRMATVG